MLDQEDELLTITQLRELLQVSRSTVYEFMNQKENPLPVFYLSERLLRFKKSLVIKWIEEQFGEKKKNDGDSNYL